MAAASPAFSDLVITPSWFLSEAVGNKWERPVPGVPFSPLPETMPLDGSGFNDPPGNK